MTPAWREHREAHEELREAAHFLEDEQEGLGDRFIASVEVALRSIVDSPQIWGVHRGDRHDPPVRTRSVAGFRYDVKYVVVDGEVVVLAYAHERRRPGYWAHRVPD